MTRALLVAVPVATLAGSLLGRLAPWPIAIPLATLVALVATVGIWYVQRWRVNAIAGQVNAWVGTDRQQPLPVRGGQPWRHLAIAVNALGAGYARRGRERDLQRALPRRFVEALTVPALLFDRDDRLVVANGGARDLLDLRSHARVTPAQALGAQLAKATGETRALGEPVRVEARLGEHDLVVDAALVGDDVLVLVADRTEERRVEEMRRDFVVNASHELKTPVAGIQALSEALEVVIDRDPGRARQLVDRLGGEASRLAKLVGDLLDLRRLEEGGPLVRGPLDLVDIVRGEVSRAAASAYAREVDVEVGTPERAFVDGVEADLRLVVANLLENAIGYNRRGGRVDVRVRPAEGGWELLVADTGIGIPQQDLDRVFERFYRVDVARSRATGGTGLGLSLVRNAAERHGGSVRVSSVLGEGSTFTVRLPGRPAS